MFTMPLAKKAVLPFVPIRKFKKELEILYARRSAVEAVIQSLEDYNRLRLRQGEGPKRHQADSPSFRQQLAKLCP